MTAGARAGSLVGPITLSVPEGTVNVGTDRAVTVTAEGGTYTLEQVRALAGLDGDLPRWAAAALIVQAGLDCPGLDLDEVFRVAVMPYQKRARYVAASRFHLLLARDPFVLVRNRLATLTEGAPRSVAVQRLLAVDPNVMVRRTLAACPAVDADVALALAGDPDVEVVRRVARTIGHAEAADAALRRLPAQDLHFTLLQRDFIPEPSWEWLAVHPDAKVRNRVALSDMAPVRVLRALAHDADADVAAAATHMIEVVTWQPPE